MICLLFVVSFVFSAFFVRLSARYDSADDALSDLQGDAESSVEGEGARSDAADGSNPMDGQQEGSEEWKLAVNKFASVRGASIYFCRDEECYRYDTDTDTDKS